jgi:hypothetical protein
LSTLFALVVSLGLHLSFTDDASSPWPCLPAYFLFLLFPHSQLTFRLPLTTPSSLPTSQSTSQQQHVQRTSKPELDIGEAS